MVDMLFGVGLPIKRLSSVWVIAFSLWVIALIARIVFYRLFLSDNPCLLMYDSGHYHTMAVHLLEQGAFCDAQGAYYFYRMPGYPLFLAACYKIFGVLPQAALAVQMVISAFMPVQVFFLMHSVGTSLGLAASMVKRVRMVVATIMVFQCGALVFSGLVMTDMLFTMFFLGFLQVLVCAWNKKTWQLMVGAGLLLGVCNLVRPLIFLPIIIVGLVFVLISGSMLRRAGLALSLCAGWGALVLCWLVRNWLLTGVWFLHTLSGPHLLNHGAIRVYAMAHHTTHEVARERVTQRLQAEINPIVASQEQERLAGAILLAYWPQTLYLGIVNCVKTVAGLYTSELMVIDAHGELPPYEGSCNMIERAKRFLYPQVHNTLIRYVCWCEILFNLVLILGFLGFVVLYWRFVCKQPLLILLLGICLCTVATTAICGFARLRLPIESILIMVSVLFYLCGARTKDSRL